MKLINKYKKEILIFLTCFIIYFSLGLIITYLFGTGKFWNVLFDMDCPRVLDDLTIRNINHHRASVHPLFILFFQPVVRIIDLMIHDFSITIMLIQSILAAITGIVVYKTLNKISKSKSLNVILLLMFCLSFGQLIYVSSVETYIYAQFFLVLLWYYAISKVDKPIELNEIIILILLGVGSIAITVTNFAQFLIVIFFIVFCNKKTKQRFLKSLVIVGGAGVLSVFLANLQNIFWPEAPNFFNLFVSEFLSRSSAESKYMSFAIDFKSFINVINSNFAYAFNIFNVHIPIKGVYVTFTGSLFQTIASCIMAVIFYGLNIWYIVKEKFNFKENKIYYAMLLTYLFNFGLHLIYGNNIAFLYITHYNFIIVFLFAYVVNRLFNIKYSKINIAIIILIILSSVRSVFIVINELYPVYNVIEEFRLLPLVLIAIALVLIIILLLNKKKILMVLLSILVIILTGVSYKWINYEPVVENCDVMCKYHQDFDLYEKQLKEMKNEFIVRMYSDRDEEVGVFFFGMADRKKTVYKDGKLYDMRTQEVLREFDYKKELIVPNEYTVLLELNDKSIVKIYENEDGIFIDNDGDIETYSKGKLEINLPEFDEYKYSEILKVLHQEILINIDGSVPKPNLFGYKTAWYRDGMLGTMVLEHTNNTDILVPWIKKVDKIYDNSRSADIDETDNLGELLYIIGATGVKRQDLVEEILDEIERLKDDEGAIGGNIDGDFQRYYPTVVALYGAKKLGVELDLVAPKTDDLYAKLTWYYDEKIATELNLDSRLYPYISWAAYHYAPYNNVYMLDEIYPLSYEGGNIEEPGKIENECFVSDFYCESNLYMSHMWAASEMFLYLIEVE